MIRTSRVLATLLLLYAAGCSDDDTQGQSMPAWLNGTHPCDGAACQAGEVCITDTTQECLVGGVPVQVDGGAGCPKGCVHMGRHGCRLSTTFCVKVPPACYGDCKCATPPGCNMAWSNLCSGTGGRDSGCHPY